MLERFLRSKDAAIEEIDEHRRRRGRKGIRARHRCGEETGNQQTEEAEGKNLLHGDSPRQFGVCGHACAQLRIDDGQHVGVVNEEEDAVDGKDQRDDAFPKMAPTTLCSRFFVFGNGDPVVDPGCGNSADQCGEVQSHNRRKRHAIRGHIPGAFGKCAQSVKAAG